MEFIIKNNKFKIRKYNDKDYRFVYNLLKKNMYHFFIKDWGEWNLKIFKKNLNEKNIKIIKYKTKRIAFYDLQFKKNFSYINNIQISSLMQKKGLGTFLINLMEKETKKKKLKKIKLKVFKDNPAKKLYFKLGYRYIKTKNSALVLEKKL